jgi:hypothetical protein
MNGTTYSFKTPTDFGHGGLTMMDGKIMKQHKKNIWEGGKSTKLDFSVTLDEGMHYLEIYGAERCCDGTTRWSFKVNSSKWYSFTTKNLNIYRYRLVKTKSTGE